MDGGEMWADPTQTAPQPFHSLPLPLAPYHRQA